MNNIEMIDMLSAKTGISKEEAEDILSKSNWDLLDAMIFIERRANGNSTFSSSRYSTYGYEQRKEKADFDNSTEPTLDDRLRKRFSNGGIIYNILCMSVENKIDILYNKKKIVSLPILLLLILLFTSFFAILILMIVGLFFNLSYRFSGPELGYSKINIFMNNIAESAKNIKTGILNMRR